MKTIITVSVTIDVDEWADRYNLRPGEVRADAARRLTERLVDARRTFAPAPIEPRCALPTYYDGWVVCYLPIGHDGEHTTTDGPDTSINWRDRSPLVRPSDRCQLTAPDGVSGRGQCVKGCDHAGLHVSAADSPTGGVTSWAGQG